MQITSTHNPLLQKIRAAVNSGRPTPDGLIVAEGPHLLVELIGSSWQIQQILSTEEALTRNRRTIDRIHAPVTELSARAFSSIASTETSQGILALVREPSWTWKDLVREQALLVVLDGIQDPGNAGTIVRSAEAFGVTGLLFMQGCVRVSNGRLLRASAGSMFRMPFVESVISQQLTACFASNRLHAFGLVADQSAPSLSAIDFTRPCALLVGSEGTGLSPELRAVAQPVTIPTHGVESLNAGVACSIALFEAARRRKSL